MSKKGPQVQEEVSPNLIPMVDIMFLLLLFFMLGADMGQREIEDVKLPHAKSVKEDKERQKKDAKDNRLTINVFHLYPHQVKCAIYEARKGGVCREESHWRVGIKGVNYTDPEKFGRRLKQESDLAKSDPANPTAISERKVQIRADEAAPYGLVQRSINQCAKVGIYKIEVGAARPAATVTVGKKD